MNLVTIKEVHTADIMRRRVFHGLVYLAILYERQSLFSVE
jgi:hypothetical protein